MKDTEAYILAVMDILFFGNITIIVAMHGNFTQEYLNKLKNITSIENETYIDFVPSNYLIPRNITSANQASAIYSSIFRNSVPTWGINSTNGSTAYSFSDTENTSSELKVTIGTVFANYSLDRFMFSKIDISLPTCTPNWTASNTSCQSSNRLTQYHIDRNNCNNANTLPENLTFSCDYDGNGIIGNITNLNSRTSLNLYINSSAANLSLNYSGRLNSRVEFKSGENAIIEFYWNFSQPLNIDNIHIEKQSSSASRGYLLVRGISANKKVLVDRLANSTKICAKNSELNSINDLTANCTSANEILLSCPQTLSNISCSLTGNFFQVEGLTNSAVREIQISAINCTPSWNCTNWTSCINNLQSKNCTDRNRCNSSMLKKTETQACISPPVCTVEWNCTNWTECSKENNQTRTCNDKNLCNSSMLKKTETQACEYKPKISIYLISITAVVIAIIAIIIVLVIYSANKKSFEQESPPATQFGYTRNS